MHSRLFADREAYWANVETNALTHFEFSLTAKGIVMTKITLTTQPPVHNQYIA
jgi:hypothetical protein